MVTAMMPESHIVLASGSVEASPLVSFAWIMAAAVTAPLISWATGKRVPAVVLLIGAGILIGPHWLGLASTEGGVGLLKQLGLGMLFLLAGYEINPAMIRSREGRTSATTWLVCMGLSFAGACVLLRPHNTSTAVVLGHRIHIHGRGHAHAHHETAAGAAHPGGTIVAGTWCNR